MLADSKIWCLFHTLPRLRNPLPIPKLLLILGVLRLLAVLFAVGLHRLFVPHFKLKYFQGSFRAVLFLLL